VTVIQQIQDDLRDAGLTLRKASPRGTDRLVLELGAEDGTIAAGQWFAAAAEAERVCELLRARFGRLATLLPGNPHLLIQVEGSDRKLTGLHRVVARPGSRLVAHRAERRAVVRLADASYLKVVRPGATEPVVSPLRKIRLADVRTAAVTHVDDSRGLVALAAVTGQTLHERIGDQTVADSELALDLKHVGVALRSLHALPVRTGLPTHGTLQELAAARRWLSAATAHALIGASEWQGQFARALAQLAAVPDDFALVHRDLHDKQLVVERNAPIGLLDLDLATLGHRAVDLANLLVHLELRVLQGLCTSERAAAAATALLEGYAPAPETREAVRAYAASTRLRLAGVYAFRPTPPGLVAHLLSSSTDNRQDVLR
jgi:tRNA A-37 threonylcarbamoyl transferase component Bud32